MSVSLDRVLILYDSTLSSNEDTIRQGAKVVAEARLVVQSCFLLGKTYLAKTMVEWHKSPPSVRGGKGQC